MKTSNLLLLSVLALCACHQAPAPSTAPPSAEQPEATQPDEVAEPEVWTNTLKWKTASEVDNFGYDVYRSEDPDGPFQRMTERPIEGAGTTDEPSQYQFVDDTIDPTKTYYYYVESISMAGVRDRFTPISKTAPKIPQDS